MIDRVHRELTETDIHKIADTYHAWRGDVGAIHESPQPHELFKQLLPKLISGELRVPDAERIVERCV